jgi:hypothetical protein
MRFWAADLLHFRFHKLGEAQRFAQNDAVGTEKRAVVAGNSW